MIAMKRMLLIPVSLLFCTGLFAAGERDLEKAWDEANTAYVNADYAAAAEGYERLLAEGYESGALYLNLGNAYFKRGMNGKAILNYHRALKLAPGDEDVRYNLSIANTRVQDRIESVPVFFLRRWFVSLGDSLGGNAWAVASLVFFALTLVGAGAYLLLQRTSWRKAGFFGAVASLSLFVLSAVYAAESRRERTNPSEAIVMRSAAPVKSSPDGDSKDIFVLHEGTKVGVVGALGEWREIRIADGNKGWIAASAIESID